MDKRTVGDVVYLKIKEIENMNESTVRATLAKLRSGIGKGISSADLEFILKDLDDFAENRDKELKIIFDVLTIFAKHQQGINIKYQSMNNLKTPFCKSLQQIPNYEKSEGIRKRFQAMLSSQTTDELTRHIRVLVSLQKEISFNYPKLANDIYNFEFDENRESIRLKWGKEFYIIKKSEETENE